MSVLEPAFEPVPAVRALAPSHSPFGAMVARQLSVWPFAARTTRLFLLLDPSLPDRGLRSGLLRAMQQAYFRQDGYSQTRAVREAAMAAHYVLQHHNHDVLPSNQVNAASVVGAVFGARASVALAGDAAAFVWRNGELTPYRAGRRLARPLGLEQEPDIGLWRTPLYAGDRLVLVCGAACHADAERTIHDVLSNTTSASAAQRELGDALGDPAGVLVVAPSSAKLRVPHLRLLGPSEHEERIPPAEGPPRASLRERLAPRRWLFPLLGLALLACLTFGALTVVPESASLAARIDGVSPHMAVHLGASAANVVDLAVGDEAVYTLDVAEGAVRAFSLDGVDQEVTPGTLVARTGTSVDAVGDSMALPVAIEYLPGSAEEPGSLAIVDQARTVVQVGGDRQLRPRAVPTSIDWQALGALGAGPGGELLFLDSGSHRLLEYPTTHQAATDPPRLMLDGSTAPRLPFERIAQVIGTPESIVLRLDDGTLHRLDPGGQDRRLTVTPVDAPVATITAIASDRAGGLYLADPANARVIEIDLDGNVLRELRAPDLSGARALDVSLDGRRLYALVDAGILAIDIPSV